MFPAPPVVVEGREHGDLLASMNNDEFWTSDDDTDVLAQYLSEHSYESAMADDGTFSVIIGDADRVPELPEETTCAVCGTTLRLIPGAGWKHLAGFNQRDGCTLGWPAA
jgi:hypothetical protein